MEEFRAGRIWVQYVGGLINRGLNKRRLLYLCNFQNVMEYANMNFIVFLLSVL